MIVPVSEWSGAAPKWICLANTGRKTCGFYEVMLWHLWLAEYNSETYYALWPSVFTETKKSQCYCTFRFAINSFNSGRNIEYKTFSFNKRQLMVHRLIAIRKERETEKYHNFFCHKITFKNFGHQGKYLTDNLDVNSQ